MALTQGEKQLAQQWKDQGISLERAEVLLAETRKIQSFKGGAAFAGLQTSTQLLKDRPTTPSPEEFKNIPIRDIPRDVLAQNPALQQAFDATPENLRGKTVSELEQEAKPAIQRVGERVVEGVATGAEKIGKGIEQVGEFVTGKAEAGVPAAADIFTGLAESIFAIPGALLQEVPVAREVVEGGIGLIQEPFRQFEENVVADLKTKGFEEGSDEVQRARSVFGGLKTAAPIAVAPSVAKVVKPALGAAGEVLGRAKEVTGRVLKRAGERQFEKVLVPTKEVTKKITQKKILPKLAEEVPIAASREGLLKKAKAKAEQFGEKINEFIEKEGVEGKVSTETITKLLEEQKKANTVKGVDVEPATTKVIEGIQDTIKQFGDSIGGKDLVRLRRIWDKSIARKGKFAKDAQLIDELDFKKQVTNSIRDELAKSNPKLDVLNKKFSFFKSLENVLEETVKRKTGQAKPLAQRFAGVTGAVAGAPGGILGAAAGAVLLPTLSKALSSTLWRTVGSATKLKLAKNLAKGSESGVAGVLKTIGEIIPEVKAIPIVKEQKNAIPKAKAEPIQPAPKKVVPPKINTKDRQKLEKGLQPFLKVGQDAASVLQGLFK